jgi:hypothetical protein
MTVTRGSAAEGELAAAGIFTQEGEHISKKRIADAEVAPVSPTRSSTTS